jgi:hypothetical protein
VGRNIRVLKEALDTAATHQIHCDKVRRIARHSLDRATKPIKPHHSKMATTAGTRKPVCPYLPPEIWHRILHENAKETTRTELWTFGRRVCSPWRSELAKLFSKKYLENGNLVQIEPDFGSSTLDRHGIHMQQLRSAFVFNRYEQGNKHRCVFTETPDSIVKRDRAYDRKMFATFEEKVILYLGTGSKSARFDFPPCRIRVGPRINDTELPNLKYDSQKREISFDWEGMFNVIVGEADQYGKRITPARYFRVIIEISRDTLSFHLIMPTYSEEDLTNALAAYRNREFTSIRKCAYAFNILYSTLAFQLSTRTSRS